MSHDPSLAASLPPLVKGVGQPNSHQSPPPSPADREGSAVDALRFKMRHLSWDQINGAFKQALESVDGQRLQAFVELKVSRVIDHRAVSTARTKYNAICKQLRQIEKEYALWLQDNPEPKNEEEEEEGREEQEKEGQGLEARADVSASEIPGLAPLDDLAHLPSGSEEKVASHMVDIEMIPNRGPEGKDQPRKKGN